MSLVRTLHHFPLDPASRQVRLALAEKRLPFEEVVVRY
ncbi:MAG: glutathione S-transferase N-terminal domain-containing protein [Caulobacteraceae bacterium]